MEHAPKTTVWGTGSPRREFLFVDDLAGACLFVLERYSDEPHLNCGSGEEATIAKLAQLVAEVVGYGDQLVFDASRPDGTPRKFIDISRLDALAWRSVTSLREGLVSTCSLPTMGIRVDWGCVPISHCEDVHSALRRSSQQ